MFSASAKFVRKCPRGRLFENCSNPSQIPSDISLGLPLGASRVAPGLFFSKPKSSQERLGGAFGGQKPAQRPNLCHRPRSGSRKASPKGPCEPRWASKPPKTVRKPTWLTTCDDRQPQWLPHLTCDYSPKNLVTTARGAGASAHRQPQWLPPGCAKRLNNQATSTNASRAQTLIA